MRRLYETIGIMHSKMHVAEDPELNGSEVNELHPRIPVLHDDSDSSFLPDHFSATHVSLALRKMEGLEAESRSFATALSICIHLSAEDRPLCTSDYLYLNRPLARWLSHPAPKPSQLNKFARSAEMGNTYAEVLDNQNVIASNMIPIMASNSPDTSVAVFTPVCRIQSLISLVSMNPLLLYTKLHGIYLLGLKSMYVYHQH